MIPLYLKTENFAAPEDPLYYLVAANGVFFVKNAGIFSAITRAENIAGLDLEQPALRLTLPRLPLTLIEKVYGFFDVVYRQWDGEAVAFLYYSPDQNQFQVDIPPQTLVRHWTHRGWRTEARVEYGSLPRPDGFVWLGDLHSHGDLRAFFSDTDDRDDGQDGLRIVIGRLDRSTPDVCVSFVTGGTRFELAASDIIEDFSKLKLGTPPTAWLQRISIRCEGVGRRDDYYGGWNGDREYS